MVVIVGQLEMFADDIVDALVNEGVLVLDWEESRQLDINALDSSPEKSLTSAHLIDFCSSFN